MAKADKATAVADIAEQFKEATATLVTEYRGLTVANLKDLRRSLGESATYTVAKNTLVKRAAAEANSSVSRSSTRTSACTISLASCMGSLSAVSAA